MKKNKKIVLIVIITIVSIIIIDTTQSLVFNNNPIIKTGTKNNEQVNINKGILIDTYNCPNERKTVIKGYSYSCSVKSYYKIVDTSKDEKIFTCGDALEEIYEDEEYTYYFNCVKSQYIEVRYKNNRKEKLTSALEKKHIDITDLNKFNITYQKERK